MKLPTAQDLRETLKLRRLIKMRGWTLFIGDLILTVVSVLGSFALRLDIGPLFVWYLPALYWFLLIALIVKPLVYFSFGLYRRLWAYASTEELKVVVAAVTSASVIISVILVVLRAMNILPNYPRLTIPIDWLLSMALIGGFRFSLRLLADARSAPSELTGHKRHVLVVGAGDAGALVVREMQKNPQLNVLPVCFLDDDTAKQRQQIHGIPVVGALDDLARMVSLKRIDEVVIALPSAPGSVVRKVADVCRRKNVPFRTMPGIYELIGGKVNVNRLREVNITDLLRRESALMDDRIIGASMGGRRVLVTGQVVRSGVSCAVR